MYPPRYRGRTEFHGYHMGSGKDADLLVTLPIERA